MTLLQLAILCGAFLLGGFVLGTFYGRKVRQRMERDLQNLRNDIRRKL